MANQSRYIPRTVKGQEKPRLRWCLGPGCPPHKILTTPGVRLCDKARARIAHLPDEARVLGPQSGRPSRHRAPLDINPHPLALAANAPEEGGDA